MTWKQFCILTKPKRKIDLQIIVETVFQSIVQQILNTKIGVFLLGNFKTVKRPLKLNIMLSFKTQSSHQNVQRS